MPLIAIGNWPIWHRIRGLQAVAVSRYVFLAMVTIATALLAAAHNVFQIIYQFTQQHQSWIMGEIFTFTLVMIIGLTIALAMRSRDLAGEIEQRKYAEQRAEALARRDSLTGLSNGRHFRDQLDEVLLRSEMLDAKVGLLTVDLDRFKPVNDTYGHAIGDQVLKAIADRLSETVADDGLVARLGGDEFAVAVVCPPGEESFSPLARQINNAIATPITLGPGRIDLTASIGIAEFPRDAATADELSVKSDLAMYKAKTGGRNSFAHYEVGLNRDRMKAASLETNLRRAVRIGELSANYQPIVRLADRSLAGFEVLARWDHPAFGRISPEVFVPLAEQAGYIDDLTQTILNQACREASKWKLPAFISFNASAVHMQNSWLLQRLQALTDATGFPLSRLEVEVTESALVADFDKAMETIVALKEMGAKVVLDDFGTGYASLRYLSELPFDKIKIDRRFIANRHSNRKNELIVASMVPLVQKLGLTVVAEGIETESDAAWLTELGCEFGQGFLFAAAMSAHEARSFMFDEQAMSKADPEPVSALPMTA